MKKVKVILPVLAVMFAVAGALATGTSKDANTALTARIAADPEDCEPIGTCSNTGTPAICSNGVVPKLMDQQEDCSVELSGNFVPFP